MGLISFGYRVDMDAIAPPTDPAGYIVAYDLQDGVLKQKNHEGVVTLVGAGASGPQGPTGATGIGVTSSFYLQGTTDYSYDTTSDIYRTGSLAIGTSTSSTSKLYVYSTQSGAFQLQDGSEGLGYTLVSDEYGVTSWTSSNIGSLPVPKVKLIKGTQSISYLSLDDDLNQVYVAGQFNLHSYPVVVTQDLSDVQMQLANNNRLFVEMVHYRRKTKKHNSTSNSSGYVTAGVKYDIWPNLPWPENFWVRNNSATSLFSGFGASGSIVRENFYPITNHYSNIPVYNMLHNRFHEYNVYYRDSSNIIDDSQLLTIIPSVGYNRAGSNRASNRFAYSSYYTPYYIAFRYIAYTPDNKIVSGPLSNIVKITHKYMPFKYDYDLSNQSGIPVANINNIYNKTELKCWLETKLP